jgi:FMN phosphatase YigB (HAD superfamily)
MTIKVLLLDIGGIFFSPCWRNKGIREVSDKLHVDLNDFKTALDTYKNPFYTGNMTEDKYWANVLDKLGVDNIKPSDIGILYRNYVKPIPEAINLLPRLSSKYTLLSFNNSSKEWMDYRIKIASLDKYFSEFFTSGYIGCTKSDINMYENVTQSYNREELFYLDDNEDYVSRAKIACGIDGKKYVDIEDLLQLIT